MEHEDDKFADGPQEEAKAPVLKLDPRQAQGFISFFQRLPEDPHVVRFFDRKDYYTVHGENATFVAVTYYKTMTMLHQLGNPPNQLSGLSVSRTMFEGILRDLLLERGDHTVEVYEGSGGNWRVTKVGSPGKLAQFEDVLFSSSNEMQSTPVVMAVQAQAKEGERHVGIAFVDMTKSTLGFTQFLDDDQFTNLEAAIIALDCRELILPAETTATPDSKKLRDVMARCSVLATERKRSEFNARDVEQDLARLLKGPSEQAKGLVDGEGGASALAALLAYTELLADDTNYGKFSIVAYRPDMFMRLDAAALRALNVLESRTDANKNFSLAGLLNRTCSAGMGKRLLNRWLKQPLLSVEEISKRHDTVQAFTEDAELRVDLRQHLKRVPDIERLVRKLERRKATLVDIVKLYQASVRLPFVKEVLERYEGEFSEHLRTKYCDALELWTGHEHLSKYDGLVEAAVDLDQVEQGEYIIAAGYDPSLGDIKAERDSVEEKIRREHSAVASELDLPMEKALKLDKTTQWGFVFRISKKEETKVRKKLNTNFISLEARKDGLKFTSAKLRRLSEQYTKLSEEYSAAQRELVAKVVEVAATFIEVFEQVAAMIADMDVLLSFADLAVSAPTPYVRPILTPSNEGDIILEGCRHPCVEVQDNVEFIPNDCKMIRGKSWFQIITGPNMGGKSTYIRQVGVNVLMAQVGCFVPASRAEISVRDCIFARVGAGDCQLRGVSTFMAEMLETGSILKAATDRSLIIIDELGRGTSTYDGFGLAWAICEHLVNEVRAPTLFATHYHELTALEHDEAAAGGLGVSNYHVSAHVDEATQKLTMLYKVEEGPCDQSFGIHVAEFAHFPESVVEMAKRKAAELEDFSFPTRERAAEGPTGVKRKRVEGPTEAEVAAGVAQAKGFLHSFAALPLDQLEPREALERLAELTRGLRQDKEAQPWLEHVLKQQTAA